MSDMDDKSKLDANKYDRVLDRIIERLDIAGTSTLEELDERIETAIELEQTAVDMSKDEAALIKVYLERDLKSLFSTVVDAEDSIATWLKFDLELLERSVAQRLLSIADKTRVDMELLREQLGHTEADYVADELALPGTFACQQCGEEQQLRESQSLKTCNSCGSVLFRRASTK